MIFEEILPIVQPVGEVNKDANTEGDEKIYCPTQDTLENEMRYPERYRDCPRHTGRCEHLIHAVRGAEALGQNQPVMPLTAGISMWAGPHPSLSSPFPAVAPKPTHGQELCGCAVITTEEMGGEQDRVGSGC